MYRSAPAHICVISKGRTEPNGRSRYDVDVQMGTFRLKKKK